jgi:hypothetical protein
MDEKPGFLQNPMLLYHAIWGRNSSSFGNPFRLGRWLLGQYPAPSPALNATVTAKPKAQLIKSRAIIGVSIMLRSIVSNPLNVHIYPTTTWDLC